ncbi:MAG: hypothetical protein FWG12_00595 [Holophagaceae bacterium]|nr:hypothetical protein [Holophagaceae bacterium]
MKILSTIAILFASAMLFAQGNSQDLDLRIQIGAELTRPYESLMYEKYITNTGGSKDLFAQPGYQAGLQIRILGELPGTHGFYYELGGRFETASRLDFKWHINDNYYIDTQDVQVSYSYFSFGGAYLFNFDHGLSVGAHLEGRVEAISASGSAFVNERFDLPIPVEGKSSYLRPWVRLSMDYTFNNHGSVRPFIGIEGAYPVLSREQRGYRWNLQGLTPEHIDGGNTQDPRLMETIAPRGSVAFYAGFRF